MKTFIKFLNEAVRGTNKEEVKKILLKHNFTVTEKSKSCLIVLADNKERNIYASKIANLFNIEIENKQTEFIIGDTRVKVKPANRQGKESAGVDNEFIIVDLINKICDYGNTPSTIKFIADNTTAKGSKKSFRIQNVIGAEHSGSDTKNRKKADIIIKCLSSKGGPKVVPISIKKDNAENWESGDTLFRNFANEELTKLERQNRIVYYDVDTLPDIEKGQIKNLSKEIDLNEIKKHLSHGKIILFRGSFKGKLNYKIFPELAWKLPDDIKADVMFGSDIKSHKTQYGCIIQKTFKGNEKVNIIKGNKGENIYEINVSHIYTNIEDAVDAHDTVLLLRNNTGRKGVFFNERFGLRTLAVYGNRVKNAKMMN